MSHFIECLSNIDTWLKTAAGRDGLDPEAATFISGYTAMLQKRAESLQFIDKTNGELYRLLHVDKNLIQREVLNPDVQNFVFPIAPRT